MNTRTILMSAAATLAFASAAFAERLARVPARGAGHLLGGVGSYSHSSAPFFHS